MENLDKILIVGGSSGVGLSLVEYFNKDDSKVIYIVDKKAPEINLNKNVIYIPFDLRDEDYSIFDDLDDINGLFITSGVGRLARFETFNDKEIRDVINVNAISPIRIIRKYYSKILGKEDFYTCVIVSISGILSSPLFALYGSSKAALSKFIESVNIELGKYNSINRILDVSPGYIEGTSFYGESTKLNMLDGLREEILKNLFIRNTIFIPQYEELYRSIIEKYHRTPFEFGIESYDYKSKSTKIRNSPYTKIGYLSGTFDLFHIGHLNLFRRAKEYCDYLIVGIHKDGSHKSKSAHMSFEERKEIVNSIKYVDLVIESLPEDNLVYDNIKYDFLFVGDDYKNSDRFNSYERYFEGKDVEIIYFPYTKKVSSTLLRKLVKND